MTPERVQMQYSQGGDSDDGGEFQTMTVEAVDAGAGHYLVIRTERWALDPDDVDALAAELRRVLAMVEPAGAGTAGE